MIGFLIIFVVPFILNLLIFRYFTKFHEVDGRTYYEDSTWEIIPKHTTVAHVAWSLLACCGTYMGTLVILAKHLMDVDEEGRNHPFKQKVNSIIESMSNFFNKKIG